jgi:hypothetical protein
MAESARVPAPGSTLHVHCPPMLAFDPGSKFTAGLLREGIYAINGFTLALAYPDDPDPNAVLDDHEALRVYTDRITQAGLDVWDSHLPDKPVRVVIEAANRPTKVSRYGRVPLRDWVIPQRIMTAVTTCFPGAVILAPQHAGGRHKRSKGGTGRPADYYPPNLIGPPPPGWLTEEPERRRDHEQAAYTLAGLAQLLAGGEGD